MLNYFAEYAAEEAQKKYQVGDEFELADIFTAKDWNYLTEEAHIGLDKAFKTRVNKSVDGIIMVKDSDGVDSKYKKVSNINKNVNYFANKVY